MRQPQQHARHHQQHASRIQQHPIHHRSVFEASTSINSADAPPRVYTYGTDGRLSQEVFDTETTSYAYTPRGDLSTVLMPDGRRTDTQYEYSSSAGRALATRVSISGADGGFATSTVYDAFGHVSTTTEGVGSGDEATTTFSYGPRGELRTVTLPGTGATWTYGHDKLLRLKKVTPPDGGAQLPQSYTYDGLGRVLNYSIGSNRTWTTSYLDGIATTALPGGLGSIAATIDGRGRTAFVQYAPGTGTGVGITSKQLTYDGWDALVKMNEVHAGDLSAQSTWTYNTSHLLTSVTRDFTEPVGYTYEANTRRRSTRGPMTWHYDARGRLSSIDSTDWSGTSTAVAWEPGGQRLQQLGDETFSYNAAGWLQAIESSSNGNRTYTYDGRGNRLTETYNGHTRQFAVDSANRLTAVKEWDGHIEAWKLKADGAKDEEKHFAPGTTWPVNFSSGGTVYRKFDYNPQLGALQTIRDVDSDAGVLHYELDDNGQVTSRTFDGKTVNYAWDIDGRLVSASYDAGTSGFEATYVYDGLGMRRRGDITTTPAVGPVTTISHEWSWAGEDGEEEISEDGNETTSVGPYRVAEGSTKFGHDALGSVTSQTTSSGPIYSEFSAWGELNPSGSLNSTAGFAGGRIESALGLNYNRRRWQDPISGTFLSRDDVGAKSYLAYPNALSAWSYSDLSPIRHTDPSGRGQLEYELESERIANEGGPNYGDSPEAKARALRLLYDGYKSAVQAGFNGIHSAGWALTVSLDGVLSVPTPTRGEYVSLPEGEAFAIVTASVAETYAVTRVAGVGVGLLPEALWESPEAYRRATLEIEQGETSQSEELYLTGVAHMGGLVGLWAGTAAAPMSRVPVLNEAPISELIHPSNWTRQPPPEGAEIANIGLSSVWEYTGPTKSILKATQSFTVRLYESDWKIAELEILDPEDSIAYILRDADTGELLKVGKSEATKFIKRFEPYRRAGERTGRRLEVDIFTFKREGFTAQSIEEELRDTLVRAGYELPWDNTGTPIGRLNRPGPGVPGAPIPRRLRDDWEWDYEEETLRPIKTK